MNKLSDYARQPFHFSSMFFDFSFTPGSTSVLPHLYTKTQSYYIFEKENYQEVTRTTKLFVIFMVLYKKLFQIEWDLAYYDSETFIVWRNVI